MIHVLWLLVIPVLLFILNYSKYFRMNSFRNDYIDYWHNTGANRNNVSNIQNKKAEIIELLEGAGIKPRIFRYIKPLGYGQGESGSASSFDNLFYLSGESLPYNMQAMAEAKEVYRRRMVNALNPLVWLEVIVFLPQRVLQYLGASPDTVSAKILNFIYWIATPLLFEPIRAYLIDLIGLWK